MDRRRTSVAEYGEVGKRCYRCCGDGEMLTLSSFWKYRKAPDGLQDECIDCQCARFRRDKARRSAQKREYARRQGDLPQRPKGVKERVAKFAETGEYGGDREGAADRVARFIETGSYEKGE